VRDGNLLAATEAIQVALRAAHGAGAAAPADDAIEGSFRVVDKTAAAPLPGDARPRPRNAPTGRTDRFVTRSYAGAAGTREYKVYLPATYDGGALPVVVMLHGCKQNPDDFAAGTRMNALADEFGFVVVYPAQCRKANISQCWNWFQAKDQRRDSGEPSLIAGITREVLAEYSLDARRVYAAGLSAGGAMAVIMGATYPDLYAAIGVHSGLAYESAQDVRSAFEAMRGPASRRAKRKARRGAPHTRTVPTIVFHGDQDTTVHPSNGDDLTEQAAAPGTAAPQGTPDEQVRHVERGETGGRTYTRTVYRERTGIPLIEQWVIHGAAHTWSGGSTKGSYTDPLGPEASREMLRFFFQHQNG
jgi:poly(hydroxyalkanoate) depolymerase family esterase